LQRKRTDGESEDAPPAKKAKKTDGIATGDGSESTQKLAKAAAEPKAPRRRKLDIAPERGSKPTPEWKRVNGKLFSELPKEEKEAIEKRRWKRRAIMRELGLWPLKGTPFPAVRFSMIFFRFVLVETNPSSLLQE
jgi:hypothetical protein